MPSVRQTQRAVQVLMHHDMAARQRRSPPYLLDLQRQILKAHRVIALHRAFDLQREDPIQIPLLAGQKGTPALGCRNLKSAVELRDILLPQEHVRRFQAAYVP